MRIHQRISVTDVCRTSNFSIVVTTSYATFWVLWSLSFPRNSGYFRNGKQYFNTILCFILPLIATHYLDHRHNIWRLLNTNYCHACTSALFVSSVMQEQNLLFVEKATRKYSKTWLKYFLKLYTMLWRTKTPFISFNLSAVPLPLCARNFVVKRTNHFRTGAI